MIAVCPIGYSNQFGDVKGGNPPFEATLEKCKTDCDDRDDCGSFSHSRSQQKCKLMKESTPTHHQYQDYEFCAKEGNSVMLIVLNT